MNIISIDNLTYILEKDIDETVRSFNIRINHVLEKKPETKQDLDKIIAESYIIYNKQVLNCKY